MTQQAFAPKIYTVRDEPVVLDSDLACFTALRRASSIKRFVETGIGSQRILLFN
jgi:hypothetical protein